MNNDTHLHNRSTMTYPERTAPEVSVSTRPNPLAGVAGWVRRQFTVPTMWLLLALLIAGLAHSWNLFSYPYLENDEGLYVAQAYSVYNEGKLTPYTYWYDHPPVGWMQLGAWLQLTGLLTFGSAINGGRIFITLVFLITCYFMFKIVAHLSGNWLGQSNLRYVTGFAAVCVMGLSPLAIFFQRQVLLDNIMIAWTMAAFYILLVRYPKEYNLLELYGSAVAIGVAFLTKITAMFFIPVLLVLVWVLADRHQKRFAFFGWLAVAGSMISTWVLYASIKGELLPGPGRVSLISTLGFHAGRGKNLPFWASGSDLRSNWEINWATLDRFTPTLGLAAIFFCLVVGLVFKSKRSLLIPAMCGLLYSLFLIRGGIVLYYYILPLLPWMAMCIALAGSVLLAPLTRLTRPGLRKAASFGVSGVIALTIGALGLWQSDGGYGQQLLTGNQTAGQVLARDYALKNIPNEAVTIADDAFYLDLRQPANPSEAKNNVHMYFKVDTDTDVRDKLLKNDWRNVDYLLITKEQMLVDIRDKGLNILKDAYEHSRVLKVFPSRQGWQLQLRQIEELEHRNEQYPAGQVMRPGETYELKVDINSLKGKSFNDLNLLLEIRLNDQKVGQDVFRLEQISSGESKTVHFRWKVPENLAPGDYEVNIGIFDQTWTENLMWKRLQLPVTVVS